MFKKNSFSNMWAAFSVLFLGFSHGLLENDILDQSEIKLEHFVYWENATVPFYIHPDHFDHEQTSIILTALTTFAYKTCLKFLPALEAPTAGQHVLVIVNPNGVRQCLVSTAGHAKDEPHYMVLGYDCLHSPHIDMMLMKNLGFGFEHNRAVRDLFIRVQKENVNPSAMDLYTMDDKLPMELRALPYDINSVLHFGERDHSKNGHRTILFLDHKVKQNRESLTELDLRKIDIVYGPECRKRDRLEKIDLCQGYPGVARRKRSLDEPVKETKDSNITEVKSLRVNPNITPPPEVLDTKQMDLNGVIDDLGLKDGVEEVTNLVYKLGAQALTHYRKKHCNASDTETTESGRRNDEKPDIVGVVELVVNYVKDMVNDAHANLTAFCEVENDLSAYHSKRCNWNFGNDRCQGNYKSTQSWGVRYSTKHHPYIPQSTKHTLEHRVILYHQGRRNDGKDIPNQPRTKREVKSKESEKGGGQRRFEGRRYNVRHQLEAVEWEASDVSMERDTKGKKINYQANNQKREAAGNAEHRIKFRDGQMKRPIPKTVELSKKNKEFYGERMWPDGVVRFVIAQDNKYDLSDLRRRLDAVNRILKERTCVSLEEISEEDTERFEDYLVLDGSADYVTGKVGGRQNFGALELFEGGQHKQHAAMMVMAMLGFYFEVARHDRDAHVRVHMRHVRPDKLHHFEKIRSDATLPLPYDYESATHPAWQFWRQLGRTGISTVATYKEKDPDGTLMRSLGQHDKLLSDIDIVKINSVYGTACFRKKKVRNDDVDTGSVIQEIDLDQDVKKPKKIHNKPDIHDEPEIHKKPEDKYKLDSWSRPKHEKPRFDIENMDRDHGRNRDRHRNKHRQERDEEYDRSRERHRDRHRIRDKRGKHEEERDERSPRDRNREDAWFDVRFQERHDKDRDMHRKRPLESEEDREEQDRVRGNHGRFDRVREEDETDIHRDREREMRHVRYQEMMDGSQKQDREGRHEKRDKRIDTDRNGDVERVNHRQKKPYKDDETVDNYDDRQIVYERDYRREQGQIFAPVKTRKSGNEK